MTFRYIDTYGRDMNINTNDEGQMRAIKNKIFKRGGWSSGLYFAHCYEPREPSYFAYCDRKGNFKLKTGNGFNSGHKYSTVGEGVLEKTDIIEIDKKEDEMAKATDLTTINLVGTTIRIGECESEKEEYKPAFETKPKWGAKWYDIKGEHIKTTFYAKKKEALAELKLAPSRTLVLYKIAEIITIDMPLKIEEV